ncbi:MAG: lipid A export permease/ATP-binding protein MsbA [Desulfobacterales bacterium]|nr:lipid A export permease/ATP-binding protein MsbA [Desulfobacterales bacterium]MDD4392188.1 lipid A export permease/ATP-binding protein MsbA [Desulfobacterales bacterium]
MLIRKIKSRHRILIRMVSHSWSKLVMAMVCMIIVAGSTSATAFLVKPVLDDIFFKKNLTMLKLVPFVIAIMYVIRGAGMYGQEYFMSYVGEDIIRKLRNNLYSRIQDLSLAFFYKEKTGVLMSRITNDVNIIKQMVATAVTSSLRDIFTIIGLTGVIFYRDWKMALCAIVVLPVAFYPVYVFGRRVRRVSTGCQESMANLSSFLHETFAGNKIVKAFGMEDYEKQRFYDRTSNLFQLEMKAVVAKSISSPIMECLGGIGISFIIWYGGYKVINGTSTAGTFFSFMTAVLLLYDPVKKLSHLNNSVQQGLAATDRVFDIIEKESDIKESETPVIITRGPHRVTYRDVSFQYDGTDDSMVLKGLNLDVKPGEIIALVGTSGGGKTSLVNLLPRFYDVSGGGIFIDGIDIRNASIASLRDQIAMVTQEPILFNDSVGSNIAYGNPDATAAQIEKAAKAAYAYDFIQHLPQKFDTSIGELGSRLSGGEKQRICIARALLKDAPVLILDEATSALDAESEMLVQKALENLMKGRTTFVIAHRLATIGYANRIIVIVDGRIVEEGSHDQLLALRGEYHKLHQMQFCNGQ